MTAVLAESAIFDEIGVGFFGRFLVNFSHLSVLTLGRRRTLPSVDDASARCLDRTETEGRRAQNKIHHGSSKYDQPVMAKQVGVSLKSIEQTRAH